jgi:hypothetical protein
MDKLQAAIIKTVITQTIADKVIVEEWVVWMDIMVEWVINIKINQHLVKETQWTC